MQGKLYRYGSTKKLTKNGPFFDVVGVGKVNCGINSDNENARNTLRLRVLQYISVNSGPWYLSKHCSSRSSDL